MLSTETSRRDALTIALAHKRETTAQGGTWGRELAAGDGWRVLEILCTFGPHDRPFEERHSSTSISIVAAGTFVMRGQYGAYLMSPGAILLGNDRHHYECSHPHGEGDRCISFQFSPEMFDSIAGNCGATRASFERNRLPPLRALAPMTARVMTAESRRDSFEEIAYELAAAVLNTQHDRRSKAPQAGERDRDRIVATLRDLESNLAEPHTLAELADSAELSRYHFLRTFKLVTGVTPHQWLLRARLREAAQRLAMTRDPVTEVALQVGFDDLSNFIRSFRAEFGVAPSRYRASS